MSLLSVWGELTHHLHLVVLEMLWVLVGRLRGLLGAQRGVGGVLLVMALLLGDQLGVEEAVGVVAHELVLEAGAAGLEAKLGAVLLILVHTLQVLKRRRVGVALEIVLIEGCTEDMFN